MNEGRNLAFIGLRLLFKNIIRSTHKAEELLFSKFPSILTFNFNLFTGCFLIFFLFCPNGLFFRLGFCEEMFCDIVKQLLFSCFPPNLIFDFLLILGVIFGPKNLFSVLPLNLIFVFLPKSRSFGAQMG